MREPLTAKALYDSLQEKLQLNWRSGDIDADRNLLLAAPRGKDVSSGSVTLVGYLNFIRPHQIQVLGQQELTFLAQLGKNSRQDSLDQLFANGPICIIVGDDQVAPEVLVFEADRNNTPLFTSRLGADEVVEYLRHYFSSRSAQRATLHGVFMEVMGIGVLMAGPTGVGKSELALELITRGHRLIADDAPEFYRASPENIMGKCPKPLKDFLEVRGLGILDIRAMFGDNALKHEERLRLIVQLKRFPEREVVNMDRLKANMQIRQILGTEIPEITLPVIMGSNLAVLVEGAVRNHLLFMKGYSATEKFITQQRRFMAQDDK